MGIFYKDCPHCAATHTAAADLCSCGYVFSGEKLGEPDLAPELAAQEEKLYEAYLAARLEQAILEARDAQRMADVDPQNQQKTQSAIDKAQAVTTARDDFNTQARKTAEAVHLAEIAKTSRAAKLTAETSAKILSLRAPASPAKPHSSIANRSEKSGKKTAPHTKAARNKKSSQAEQRRNQAKQVEAAKRLAEQARLQAEKAKQAKRQAELAEDARRRTKLAEEAKQVELAERAKQAKHQVELAEAARRRTLHIEAAHAQEAQRREAEQARIQAEQIKADQAQQEAEQAKHRANQAEDARRRAKQREHAKLQAEQAGAAKQIQQQAAAALAARAYLAAQAAKAEQAMKALHTSKLQVRSAAAEGAAFKSAQAARAAEIMRPDTRECPNCTAIVSQDTAHCACGYQFSSGETDLPRLSLSPAEQSELLRQVAFETFSKHR